MILRKPYAFFIKHFKLFHVILAIMAVYSIYKTKILLDFFNEYSKELINIVGQDLVTPLLPFSFQIIPILILIVLITILVIMLLKKKPYIFYVISIGIFLYTAIILQVSKSILNSLFFSLVDVQTIRLIHDLIAFSFFTQLVIFVILFIRAVGFDVKKFDFKQDLKEIEINEEDREEVEIQINFDTNKGIRNIRKQIRYLKYTYKENKRLFQIVSILFTIFIIIFLSLILFKKSPILQQNTYFSSSIFSVNLENSYLVNSDYKGKILNEDYNYLILQLKIKNKTNNQQTLDLATAKIKIDNYIYIPTLNYKDSFFDFGKVYQNDVISNEYQDIILVYEIPKQLIDKQIIFSFVDKIGNNKITSTDVKINYINLIGKSSSSIVTINNTLEMKDSILSDYQLNISAYDIQKQYKLDYNFCVSNVCYPSVEYLKPSIITNYEKVLLKIKGTLIKEKNIDGVYDLYDFIDKFGQLKYVVNGETKIQNIKFKEIISKRKKEENIYYIEVLSEVKDASNISLVFTIRDKKYEYVLK